MPLPSIATPTHELELPSTGQVIEYRPFLVKEEKILVLALESGSQNQITKAVKDVLKNCIKTKGVKVDKLPTFDIEYLFLNVRAKSVGESVDIEVTCPDDGETTVTETIYLDDIQVAKDPNHNPVIDIGNGYFIKMKYPSLDQFIETNFEVEGSTTDQNFKKSLALIASCIDSVYSEDEAWDPSDCTKKELTDFIEQLNSSQFKEIEKFFETTPKLAHTVTVVNPNTKVKSEVTIEGLASFFA